MRDIRVILAAVAAFVGIIAGIHEIASDEPRPTPHPVVENVEHIDTVNIEQAPLVSVSAVLEGEAIADGLRGGVADVAALYLPPPKPPREPLRVRMMTALSATWAKLEMRWQQATKALDAKRRLDEWRGRL